MALWRLYYHLVWATRKREPLIDVMIEQLLFGYLKGKSNVLGGMLHAVNGTENHIHLLASIPPRLSIADFVQRLKGSSTHYINHEPYRNKEPFGWQRGYAVFSLGGKQMAKAMEYVANQKTHHRQGTIIPALEQLDEPPRTEVLD